MESILFISLSAIIAGADNWTEVYDFAVIHQEWVETHVPLPNGVPSHDTFSRFFSIIDPIQFEECFRAWAATFSAFPLLSNIIAVDGKSIKGVKTGPTSSLHMVSAWSTSAGISLGQVKTPEKKSELVAIRDLLDQLYLTGSIVTLDALSTRPEIAKKIIESKADYMIQVKKNQMGLYGDIERAFEYHSSESYVEFEKKRIKERVVKVLSAELISKQKNKWDGLTSIVHVQRHTDKKVEHSYYITSLQLNAEHAAKIIRSHWSIENNLHWQLDVTFKEDLGRDRNHNAAQNHSLLRKIALTVLNYYKPEISNPRKRKMMSMNPSMINEAIGREGFWGKFIPFLDQIRDWRPPVSSESPKEPLVLCGRPVGLDKSSQ